MYTLLDMMMDCHTNRRRLEEHFIKFFHCKLEDLREEARKIGLHKEKPEPFIFRNDIFDYPKPEFHVSYLKHDTQRGALCQIWKDGGFKDPFKDNSDGLPLVWWSLAVKPQHIWSAERRILEEFFSDQTEEQAESQQSFLWKFASSPAFSEKSRYGSYRFTLTVEEVLEAYSEQFCSGKPPVMRLFKTSLYKQEVMYAVLVHSPDKNPRFKHYPKLLDDDQEVCAYRDGRFIWNSQAMCGTHKYKLRKDENNQADTGPGPNKPHVWDHVALALHVQCGQVLKFDSDRLRANLTFCDRHDETDQDEILFDSYDKAQFLVECLWPKFTSPLKKEPSLKHFISANREAQSHPSMETK